MSASDLLALLTALQSRSGEEGDPSAEVVALTLHAERAKLLTLLDFKVGRGQLCVFACESADPCTAVSSG